MKERMTRSGRIPLKVVGKARTAALLDEAASELNSRGVSQASLAAIAERLGITRAALYYYVKDQEDLVFQCYRRACETMARRLSTARKASEDALEILHTFVGEMLAPDQPEIAALWELGYLTGERREIIDGLLDGIVAQLVQILEKGISDSAIRPCEPVHVAWILLGIISWPSLLKRSGPEFDEAIARPLAPKINDLLTWGVADDRRQPPQIDIKPLPIATLRASDIFTSEHVAEAKRESLLAAGSRLFNRKGIDATSLDDIAGSVGVSKAVIYHNIGDKQAFVLECFHRSYRLFIGMSEAMDADPASRLEAAASVLHQTCRLYLDASGPLVIPMVGFEALPHDTGTRLQQLARELGNIWEKTLKSGVAEHSFREIDINLVVAVTSAYIQWNTKWNFERNALVADELATEMVNLWCLGLAPCGKVR